MVTYKKTLAWCVCILFISSVFVSCYGPADEDLDKALSRAELKITTRSAGEMIYPLTVYAFDRATEECRLQKTFDEEAASGARFELPEGKYRLVTMCGTAGCEVPAEPSLSSAVVLPDDNYLDHPLMQGSADLTVNGDASVDIMMYYSVASISVSLSGIPIDVAAVDVTFSDFFQTLGFDGNCGGTAAATVSCRKSGELWVAPTVYVLPGSGQKLGLTVSLTAADGTKSEYGYTYRGAIVANTPYRFSGNYESGFHINGTVDVAAWGSGEDVAFAFGVGVDDNDDAGSGSGTVDPGGRIEVSRLPETEEIWNGHFVALLQNADASGADVLLLSLAEWQGVHAEPRTAGAAQALADGYVEAGMSGWRIPTKEEVLAMKDAFGVRLSAINQVLASVGGDVLSDSGVDAEKNDIRYLCEGGTKSFTWEVRSSSISPAGIKRTYYLRAVKKLRMVLTTD